MWKNSLYQRFATAEWKASERESTKKEESRCENAAAKLYANGIIIRFFPWINCCSTALVH